MRLGGWACFGEGWSGEEPRGVDGGSSDVRFVQ